MLLLQLCFAYKGKLQDKVGMKFSYINLEGVTSTVTAEISVSFNRGQESVLTHTHTHIFKL